MERSWFSPRDSSLFVSSVHALEGVAAVDAGARSSLEGAEGRSARLKH